MPTGYYRIVRKDDGKLATDITSVRPSGNWFLTLADAEKFLSHRPDMLPLYKPVWRTYGR